MSCMIQPKNRDSNGRYVKGHCSGMTGKKQSDEMKGKLSNSLNGHEFWGGKSGWIKKGQRLSPDTEFKGGGASWNRGKKMSNEARHKMSETKRNNPVRYWLGKKRPGMSGENSKFWKGGITPINELVRRSIEYKDWREAIFTRDDYTCQLCGERGGRIHAHHIEKFSNNKKLRFDVGNGITLCKACHTEEHKIEKEVK